jgi:PAS domain S-box-containing protein
MEQDSLMEFVAAHTLEIMLLFDGQGRITYCNEAAKQQLSYDEGLVGIGISDIFPRDFSQTEEGFETERDFNQEFVQLEAYRKNRTCFMVEAQFMKYESNPPVYVCFARDISRQIRLEKKAEQAKTDMEEALLVKTQFTANVTHELRTPVNGILGNTQELLEQETDPEKLSRLRLVERACKDMHAIINNILDFSKLDAGKFTLQYKKFNFRNMIDYVRANHIHKITEKGLEFFLTISPAIPEYIIGDELRIVQVLNNLLSNACKFTTAGRISLEVVMTAQEGNRAELFFMVMDSGIGIKKEDQDKLFKSFSQIEASTSRKYGGSGLGLYICKQLVELMDGSIRVESEKGKGTMFSFHIWVELPIEELKQNQETVQSKSVMQKLPTLSEAFAEDEVWQYGEERNLEELKKKMSKLILSVEMENWEKAEMFAETIKQLTAGAPQEIRSAFLRLKMAVQKGDHDKTVQAYDRLQKAIEENSVGKV